MNESEPMPKHVLATLRKIIGLTQKELGALVGRSLATIQGIEYNEMPLSPGLADELAHQTGIDIAWLLKNDTKQPPVSKYGRHYAKSDYESTQAARNHKLGDEPADGIWAKFFIYASLAEYVQIAMAAIKKDKFLLLNYKFRTSLEKLRSEFGSVGEIHDSVFDVDDELKKIPTRKLDPVSMSSAVLANNLKALEQLIDATVSKKTKSRHRPR